MIRVAAAGDVHLGCEGSGLLRAQLEHVADEADVLLLAGDLTNFGMVDEAKVVAADLTDLGLPVVTVLGNHDYQSDEPEKVAEVLTDAGVCVLEGDTYELRVGDQRLGVAGVKGFGHGFRGAAASDFGEPEIKAFVRHAEERAADLEDALGRVRHTDVRVALMHYSPIPETLKGERPEIYPFLGSYFLQEAVDAVGADLALHGHAHGGTEVGHTPAGVPVRNVAQAVIRAPYRVYALPMRPPV